jgi:hypothetical protein
MELWLLGACSKFLQIQQLYFSLRKLVNKQVRMSHFVVHLFGTIDVNIVYKVGQT